MPSKITVVNKRQRLDLDEVRYRLEVDDAGHEVEGRIACVFLTCPTCGTRSTLTPHTGVAEVDEYAPLESLTIHHYLCKCEFCDGVLYVRFEEYDDDRDYYFTYAGHYPVAGMPVGRFSIPETVESPLSEAAKCLNVGALHATVVMCRRAVEATLRDQGQREVRNLKGAIETLAANGVLHQSMVHLADLIREVGNAGAHDGEVKVSHDRAKETFELTRQLVDIIFVAPARAGESRKRLIEERRKK